MLFRSLADCQLSTLDVIKEFLNLSAFSIVTDWIFLTPIDGTRDDQLKDCAKDNDNQKYKHKIIDIDVDIGNDICTCWQLLLNSDEDILMNVNDSQRVKLYDVLIGPRL